MAFQLKLVEACWDWWETLASNQTRHHTTLPSMHPRTGCVVFGPRFDKQNWYPICSDWSGRAGIGSSMLDPWAFQDSWSFALYLLQAMALDEVPPVALMQSTETYVCSNKIKTIWSSFWLFLFCSNQPLNKDVISYNSAINACAKEKGPPGRSNQLEFSQLYGFLFWAPQDGQWQLAIYLLLAMQQSRLHPDVISASDELGKSCAAADDERSLCRCISILLFDSISWSGIRSNEGHKVAWVQYAVPRVSTVCHIQGLVAEFLSDTRGFSSSSLSCARASCWQLALQHLWWMDSAKANSNKPGGLGQRMWLAMMLMFADICDLFFWIKSPLTQLAETLNCWVRLCPFQSPWWWDAETERLFGPFWVQWAHSFLV